MGVVRKAASVSTLGLISFRSKKERLRRAEGDYRKAAQQLADEKLARADADRRVEAAEHRSHDAELLALREAKAAAKHGRRADRAEHKRRGRRGRRRTSDHPVRESLSELAATVQPVVEARAAEASRRGRSAAKRAAKAAERAAAKVKDRVEA